MNEVVYFSVNNWFCGEDYPPTENFKKWLGSDLKQAFRNDEWAKENKLCIYCGSIDMSMNYTIAAPREWVEKNCPELLTDDEFTYRTCIYNKDGDKVIEYKKKYSDFVDQPDEYGDVEDHRFGWPYLEYKPENFGVHWYHDPDEYWDDEDENEEEDETPEEQPEEKSVNQEEEIDDEEDDDFSLFGWLTDLFKIKR